MSSNKLTRANFFEQEASALFAFSASHFSGSVPNLIIEFTDAEFFEDAYNHGELGPNWHKTDDGNWCVVAKLTEIPGESSMRETEGVRISATARMIRFQMKNFPLDIPDEEWESAVFRIREPDMRKATKYSTITRPIMTESGICSAIIDRKQPMVDNRGSIGGKWGR